MGKSMPPFDNMKLLRDVQLETPRPENFEKLASGRRHEASTRQMLLVAGL
jgi:hypothetical protein